MSGIENKEFNGLLCCKEENSSPVLNFTTIHSYDYYNTHDIGTKMAIVADLGQTYNSTETMLHVYDECHFSDQDKEKNDEKEEENH